MVAQRAVRACVGLVDTRVDMNDVAFGDGLSDAFSLEESEHFVDAQESFDTLFSDCCEDAFEVQSEFGPDEMFYECDGTL